MFRDRVEAGQQLAEALSHWQVARPLVLVLPRGGVVVGAEIAHRLRCDLDVLLVKKLRAPGNPELALGAVGENGSAFLNEEIMRALRPTAEYVEAETRRRVAEITDQRRRYRKIKAQAVINDRSVFIVDDGLATGASMIAAIQTVALAQPRKLIVAVPVAPPDTLRFIQQMPPVTAVECLHAPTWFTGVGQFYHDFTQVTEAEVTGILAGFAEPAARG